MNIQDCGKRGDVNIHLQGSGVKCMSTFRFTGKRDYVTRFTGKGVV